MDSAAPTAMSSPLPSRADLLAEARCRKCGYPLRGLPEDRCPECGTEFDPEGMATGFIAEWPRLMSWYMVGWILLTLLHATQSVLYAIGKGPPGDIEVNLLGLPCVNNAPLVILFGVPGIIGLRRCVDWARGAIVILLLLLAAVWMLIVIASTASTTTGPQLRVTFLADSAACLLENVLPPLVLAVILLTGLRSRSLRRSEQNLVPRLPLEYFRPRNDWPLLLCGVLGGCALTRLGMAAHWGGLCHYLSGMAESRHADWCLCHFFADSAFALAFAAGILILWKRPARAKLLLASLLGISLAAELTFPILDIAFFHTWSVRRDTWLLLSAGIAGISNLIVPLVMCLYVSLALPLEAIARVARPESPPDRQPVARDERVGAEDGAI